MSKKIPKLSRHASGRGYTTDPFTRKEVYHGVYGTKECQRNYEVWLQRLFSRRAEVASGAMPGQSVKVAQLLADYLSFAKGYYVKHSEPTSEYVLIKRAAVECEALFSDTEADAFGPSSLKAVRQRLIDRGNARTTVNKQVMRLIRAWRWGVEHEVVKPLTLVALEAVKHLGKGRSKARETEPVEEVPLEVVEQTIALLKPQTRVMVQIHLWSCMRAEEVVAMRPMDIDQSQDPWLYVPWSHKTEHHDRKRRIWLGPQAQALLGPILAKCRPTDWVFHHTYDQKPIQVYSYRKRIATCCARHNIPLWSPRQLRHTALTLVRKKYGLEGAQRAGGHSSARITEIYTERDEELARKIANDLG